MSTHIRFSFFTLKSFLYLNQCLFSFSDSKYSTSDVAAAQQLSRLLLLASDASIATRSSEDKPSTLVMVTETLASVINSINSHAYMSTHKADKAIQLMVFLIKDLGSRGMWNSFMLACRRGWLAGINFLVLVYLSKCLQFSAKKSRNYHHSIFYATEYKSLSHKPNHATQHKLNDKQCRSWSANFWRYGSTLFAMEGNWWVQKVKKSFCFISLFEAYSKTCLKRPLKNRQNKCLKDKW